MACEKYSSWITGAALGGLRPAEEAELRAHAFGCSGCRSEWERMRVLVAAVDRSVEAMAAGAPSAEFAARLRARIAEEPAPTSWPFLTWPRLSAAALAAAAAVAAVLLVRAPERAHPSSPISVDMPAPVAPPRPAQGGVTPERTAASARAGSDHGRIRGQSRSNTFSMDVLVPSGQLSAALRLSEGVEAGTIDGEQLSQLTAQSAEPLAVKALVVAPLESASSNAATDAAARTEGGHN